jgi:hypothetical protein
LAYVSQSNALGKCWIFIKTIEGDNLFFGGWKALQNNSYLVYFNKVLNTNKTMGNVLRNLSPSAESSHDSRIS